MGEANKDLVTKRVLMARRVASAWLTQTAKPEFRLEVLQTSSKDTRKVVRLLLGHRDGKCRISGVPDTRNFGLQESKDCLGSFVVWSGDRDVVIAIQMWLESLGYETSGVW